MLHRGLMDIKAFSRFNPGSSSRNYEQALEIIQEQLGQYAAGQSFRAWNDQTKAMISNHLRELQDSAYEMIGFDFNSSFFPVRERTAEQLFGAGASGYGRTIS